MDPDESPPWRAEDRILSKSQRRVPSNVSFTFINNRADPVTRRQIVRRRGWNRNGILNKTLNNTARLRQHLVAMQFETMVASDQVVKVDDTLLVSRHVLPNDERTG